MGSGGNRVCTRPPKRPAAKSALTFSRMKSEPEPAGARGGGLFTISELPARSPTGNTRTQATGPGPCTAAANTSHLRPIRSSPTRTGRRSGVTGGGRSPGWAQATADVLDRPMVVADQPHLATARAAALLALVRCRTLERSVHDPAPRHRALYDHRQSQFEACFEALLPIHTALGGTP